MYGAAQGQYAAVQIIECCAEQDVSLWAEQNPECIVNSSMMRCKCRSRELDVWSQWKADILSVEYMWNLSRCALE